MRASETAEVLLEQCRVPAAQLLGEEGQGFIQTLQVLDAGRIGIAALAVGLAQGAYECARHYAFERRQFGRADRHVSVDSLPSWPATPPASKRRGCSPTARRGSRIRDGG